MLSYNEEQAYTHIEHLNEGSSEGVIGQWSGSLKLGIVPSGETLNELKAPNASDVLFMDMMTQMPILHLESISWAMDHPKAVSGLFRYFPGV